MSFTSLNRGNFRKIDWNYNTQGFKFRKLADVYKEGKTILKIKGFFFTNSKEIGLQSVAICEEFLLNLPKHKNEVVSEILNSETLIREIKKGHCFIEIRPYEIVKPVPRTCFTFDFIDNHIF